MCMLIKGDNGCQVVKNQQQQIQMLSTILSFSCEAALGPISLLPMCPLISWTALFLDGDLYDQHSVEQGYPLPHSGCCVSINETYNYVYILGNLIIPLTHAEYKSPET